MRRRRARRRSRQRRRRWRRAGGPPPSRRQVFGEVGGSVARRTLRVAGVPQAAAVALARLSISLVVLQSYPVEWAVACLAEEKVTLGPRESQQLAAVIAPRGNRNMPVSAQAPSEQAQPVPAALENPEPEPYYFVKCATANCHCLSSYNGAPHQACSRNCRYEYRCSLTAGASHLYHDTSIARCRWVGWRCGCRAESRRWPRPTLRSRTSWAWCRSS